MFKGTQLQKISKYDISQKTLFFTLVSTMNAGLSAIQVAVGQYL